MTTGRPAIAPTRASATAATAASVTLGAAAVCWVIAIGQMRGMDMGVSTELGSFASFTGLWIPMMAAMMLPSAIPALTRTVTARGRIIAAPLFAAAYLATWVLVGLAVYVLYSPHSTDLAGVIAVTAGAYELTPAKRYFRRRCHEQTDSGVAFGLYCLGSSVGLMAVMVAFGAMSIGWMAVIATVVIAQKLLPADPSRDVPLAVALVALGVLVLITPSSVPGLVPQLTHHAMSGM